MMCTETRFILCSYCGTEGRIIRTKSGHPNDPDTYDDGPCPVCEGERVEEIEVEPIEMEDLDEHAERNPLYREGEPR